MSSGTHYSAFHTFLAIFRAWNDLQTAEKEPGDKVMGSFIIPHFLSSKIHCSRTSAAFGHKPCDHLITGHSSSAWWLANNPREHVSHPWVNPSVFPKDHSIRSGGVCPTLSTSSEIPRPHQVLYLVHNAVVKQAYWGNLERTNEIYNRQYHTCVVCALLPTLLFPFL